MSNSHIKITKKAKKSATIKAVSEGISYLKAKVGTKTYSCMVFVKEKSSAPQVTPKPEENSDYVSGFSIPQQEIYNGNGVFISVNNAKKDNECVVVEFLVANNSETDYSVYPRQYAVNDLMAGGNNYAPYDVSVGKKITFSISIEKDWFEDNNIKEIKKIDIYFTFYKDYKTNWDTETITIKTDADNGTYYEPKGKEIFSDDNILLYLLSNDEKSYKFCLKSNLPENDYWSVENCSINDWMYDLGSCKYDLFGEPIISNKYSVFTLVVDKDFTDKNGIKSIKSIEFEIDFGEYKPKIKLDL